MLVNDAKVISKLTARPVLSLIQSPIIRRGSTILITHIEYKVGNYSREGPRERKREKKERVQETMRPLLNCDATMWYSRQTSLRLRFFTVEENIVRRILMTMTQ